ncbi:hypothetical protein H0H87_006728 [Tephrocybe sp. NHM501043]|nr:hypothetical protein H0H87_006728 [Tephrocybe sp. NHM501043]
MSDGDTFPIAHKSPYKSIIINPTHRHTATVIWLHGLGGSGESMSDAAETLLKDTPGLEHVKFIFPTAHSMKVTASKETTRAWWDIWTLDLEECLDDEQGMLRAASLIDDISTNEELEHSIPPNRVVLGGLSQGGAAALVTAMTTTYSVAGVFVLSGFVPLRKKIKDLASPLAPTLPIFWGHGSTDPLVRVEFALETAGELASDLEVPFALYTGRLGAFFTEPLVSDPEPFDNDSEPSDASSASAGSMEESQAHVPRAALAAEELKRPGIFFVTYKNLDHWMNDVELQDLGIWLRALLPKRGDESDMAQRITEETMLLRRLDVGETV